MKLRKLTLQGYKTFATKTEFIFDNGITAIVGPNGSGKSNIADALRWVLGEQSYSTLRARRSADMIFAGSAQRARAGLAQATITLDNSDGWLPIDYTEVEITRRSFRSGENEYLINGQHVRLKDVADLLATSGLAERTYTIVGQGLVDQALSLRSDERRALFEEAAGITHYKSRRAETLRRLEETQRNLQRVYDILEELKPRITSLRRQATRTRNYEQISTDLRVLLRVWYGYKWEQAKQDLRVARQTAATAESAWEDTRGQLRLLQTQIDEIQQQITQTQQEISTRRATRDQLREAVEQARREQAVLRERRTSLERQQVEAEDEFTILTRQQAAAQAELEAAVAELTAAQTEMQTHQGRMDQFRTAYQAQQTEIAQKKTQVSQLETERRRAQTALAQAEGQLIQLRERLGELAATAPEADPVEREIATLLAAQQTSEAAMNSAQEQLASLQAERAAESRARQTEIGRLKDMRRAGREDEQTLGRLRSELARLEERVAMLERTQHQDLKMEPPQLVGQLAGLVQLPAQYETALAAALGDHLATWVVTDDSALWQAVESARQQRDGKEARLLLAALAGKGLSSDRSPGNHQRPQIDRGPGIIGWANELTKANGPLQPLIDQLLGTILLVEDGGTAYRLASSWPPGYLAVTPEGLVVHSGGLVEVQPANAAGQGILARQARLRQEVNRLEDKRRELAQREAEATGRQKEIDSLQEQVDGRTAAEQQLAQKENEARGRLAAARQTLDRNEQQRQYLARQQAERTQARTQIETRLGRTEAAITEQKAQLDQIEQSLAAAREALAALPVGEAEQQQNSLRQALNAAQTILAGRQAVVDSRRSTLNQIDGQLNRLQNRLTQWREQLAELPPIDEDKTRPIEEQLTNLEAGLSPLLAEIEADRARLAATQRELAGIQTRGLELETQFTQMRVRQTQQENQIEGLQERIRNDLGLVSLSFDADQDGATPLPIHEVVEQLPVVTMLPPDIEEDIRHHRGQLQRMGPVNPDAPAELEETEERFEFLSQQVEDLARTDEQLRAVIAELDELTSKAFTKTVEQVNELFDQTFRQLFGGGSGRLMMTNPDDPTSSGVEIVARLPNRREQGLALLSGGERSLTAAALIFSLLKVSPPPFCVLDEVDAALDEANVNRFRDLLSELSRDTQFILITHNRGTVQAARTLYGVSMQPDSASQVISIRPEDYMRR